MENIETLIDAIKDGNFSDAKPTLDAIMTNKLNDALDAEKASVAADIFGNNDDDFTDEDLDRAVDDYDDDDFEDDEDE